MFDDSEEKRFGEAVYPMLVEQADECNEDKPDDSGLGRVSAHCIPYSDMQKHRDMSQYGIGSDTTDSKIKMFFSVSGRRRLRKSFENDELQLSPTDERMVKLFLDSLQKVKRGTGLRRSRTLSRS